MTEISLLSPKLFYVSVAVAIIIVIGTVYLIYKDHWLKDPTDHTSGDDKVTPEEEEELRRKFLSSDVVDSSGGNSRMTWTQDDNEIDVYIPIPADIQETITPKGIKVIFKTSSLSVTILDRVIINGPLVSDIVASDSIWQLERVGSARRIWITLFKKIPTDAKTHWGAILAEDLKPHSQ